MLPRNLIQRRQRQNEPERQAGVDVVPAEPFAVRKDQSRSDADDVDAERKGGDDVVPCQAVRGAQEEIRIRRDEAIVALFKIITQGSGRTC